MRLFFFELHHPQLEGGPSSVNLIAADEDDARAILENNLFFAQDKVNGHFFDLIRITDVPLPANLDLDVHEIRLEAPDGKMWSKFY